MHKKITCLVGIFPPPLHGMSIINLYILNLMAEKGLCLVINYSPNTLNRQFYIRLYKLFLIPKNLMTLLLALINKRVGSIYIGLSAGYGQIYDLLFIGLGRLFQRNIFLHHHSYRYIYKPTLLSRALFFIAGKDARHVASTRTMKMDLEKTYNINHVQNISGIFALDSWCSSKDYRDKIHSIGYLSNISYEKGISEFLDTAEMALREAPGIKFILAGPYQDSKIERYVQKNLTRLKNVEYVGALVGDEKKNFFDSIDLFLFPTKNQDEAEGLVIHEAMSMGVPVIAHNRRQVWDILTDKEGIIVDLSENYANKVLSLLKICNDDSSILPKLSKAAHESAKSYKEKNILLINDLCTQIAEGI